MWWWSATLFPRPEYGVNKIQTAGFHYTGRPSAFAEATILGIKNFKEVEEVIRTMVRKERGQLD